MFPDFLPPSVHQLTEPTSVDMARQIRLAAIKTDLSDRPLASPYVCQGQGNPPLVMLHGFDSSLLEFRRLLGPLAAFRETWAVDLLGFGFSDRPQVSAHSPTAIKHHLYSFWHQRIGRPMVLVGASMGGAAALDFVLTYPEVVSHLVLLDSAGLAAGPALDKLMVPPLDRWATAFLKNPWVRRRISRQAYYDQRWVTADAECCASLHVDCPHWSEALISFTKSGGYTFLGDRVADVAAPTLVIWGRQDKILGTRDATRFVTQIPCSKLFWIDQCGHVPHLEKANDTVAAIQAWLSTNP